MATVDMHYQQALRKSEALRTGGFISYSVKVAKETTKNAAILLGQLVRSFCSFTKKRKVRFIDGRPMFYLSRGEIFEETAITKREQYPAQEKLVEAGYLEVYQDDENNRVYFYVTDKVLERLEQEDQEEREEQQEQADAGGVTKGDGGVTKGNTKYSSKYIKPIEEDNIYRRQEKEADKQEQKTDNAARRSALSPDLSAAADRSREALNWSDQQVTAFLDYLVNRTEWPGFFDDAAFDRALAKLPASNKRPTSYLAACLATETEILLTADRAAEYTLNRQEQKRREQSGQQGMTGAASLQAMADLLGLNVPA